MAIAFARVSIHSRSKGHSAVAASAYRTASKLFDKRTGTHYDFSHRRGLMFSEIILPEGAAEKFLNREFLWNEVERVENRKNSQLCKDLVLALPKELTLTQQIELARRFARVHFTDHGLVCDIAIHDDNDGNPHVHILMTLRRLDKIQFAKHKARDLNPQFAKGFIVEGDFWNEDWRSFQNNYFQEIGLDLDVDLDHVIPEKHEGRQRDCRNHYLKEENQFIRAARVDVLLKDIDNIINHLSLRHSVFTKRDIENLYFKTVNLPNSSPNFLTLVEKILTHKDVIHLGANDEGKDAYTTRPQFIAEANLLKKIEAMNQRETHNFKIDHQLLGQFTLNAEQREAFSYIAHGKNISVVIGRPGVGKSYLLKPLKAHYEANHCRVIGAALSGKVAKALNAEAGINSYTIASLIWRLNHEKIKLNSNDIIIIDEAGMVDFDNLSYLIKAAAKAKAKMVLVGDPDQLKPIHKGEIFRAIAAKTGYIELGEIRRQRDAGDRIASVELTRGNIDKALTHYQRKGAIHFSRFVEDSIKSVAGNWQETIHSPSDIQQNVMFAFSRMAVASLNQLARKKLQEKNIIESNELIWQHFINNEDQLSLKEIALSVGERILFRKNDKELGFHNGDMAFIESINQEQLCARLDSGVRVTVPHTYHHIDYGYATTVHKGQGMTVDNSMVLIDSQFWDRNLSLVAMTRHRNNLSIFADTHQHPNMDALKKTLSRSSTKDNVIDWPIDFAIRAGFEPETLISKALNHIAKIGHRIKNKWNYLINYEAYLKIHEEKLQTAEETELRKAAKEVANYLDEKMALNKEIILFEKELRNSHTEQNRSPDFVTLYHRKLASDKNAYILSNQYGKQFNSLPKLPKAIINLQTDAKRYERYLAIQSIAEITPTQSASKTLLAEAYKIDLQKDYAHIKQLAGQNHKKPHELLNQIKHLQQMNRELLFKTLRKDYPLLNEYYKLALNRANLVGYKAEQVDKSLKKKAREIIKNKILYETLQQDFPKLSKSLLIRTKFRVVEKGFEL